jgi:hypothetical protein
MARTYFAAPFLIVILILILIFFDASNTTQNCRLARPRRAVKLWEYENERIEPYSQR